MRKYVFVLIIFALLFAVGTGTAADEDGTTEDLSPAEITTPPTTEATTLPTTVMTTPPATEATTLPTTVMTTPPAT
ncbi:MAG: hypothetical protein O0X96_03980, partial [Methanocorpusculum sp.]|nr:hypothetical protein [Methanocorpusculum sp.]